MVCKKSLRIFYIQMPMALYVFLLELSCPMPIFFREPRTSQKKQHFFIRIIAGFHSSHQMSMLHMVALAPSPSIPKENGSVFYLVEMWLDTQARTFMHKTQKTTTYQPPTSCGIFQAIHIGTISSKNSHMRPNR